MVCGTPSHAPQISRQRWSCLDIFKRRSTDDKIVLVIFVIVISIIDATNVRMSK